MICEKCGFETGPSAKFCAVCGSPVMPAQIPVAAPDAELEPVVKELVWEEASPAEEAVCEVAEEATEIQPEEIVENAAPLFEEAAAESYEIPVYNPEMAIPEEPVAEPSFAPPVTNAQAPAEPAAEIPQMPPIESAPENAQVPPVFPGMPMYGVPTGQMYNGIPVYAMPNVPMYNGAPNAQPYNSAPNAQPYNGAPNAQPYNGAANGQAYNGAPVYQPMYNMPGYGAPVQAYPGGPVYAAPMYNPQGAPMYAPGYYGAEPVKETPKTISIVALLGSIAAIVAIFLSLFGYTEMSMVKLISEEIPNIIDSFEYLDMLGTFAYLTIAAVAICVLCVVFAAIVFLLVLLKKKCRGTAIFSMLLLIAFAVVFVFMRSEAHYYHIDIDFDFIMRVIKDLGVGFWLYLGGMFVAVIGGGKR